MLSEEKNKSLVSMLQTVSGLEGKSNDKQQQIIIGVKRFFDH